MEKLYRLIVNPRFGNSEFLIVPNIEIRILQSIYSNLRNIFFTFMLYFYFHFLFFQNFHCYLLSLLFIKFIIRIIFNNNFRNLKKWNPDSFFSQVSRPWTFLIFQTVLALSGSHERRGKWHNNRVSMRRVGRSRVRLMTNYPRKSDTRNRQKKRGVEFFSLLFMLGKESLAERSARFIRSWVRGRTSGSLFLTN